MMAIKILDKCALLARCDAKFKEVDAQIYDKMDNRMKVAEIVNKLFVGETVFIDLKFT